MTDLDREVAEKVMGWYQARSAARSMDAWYSENGRVQAFPSDWSPSTRIDHAWEAVTAMLDKHGFVFSMRGGLGTFDAAFNDHCSSAIGPFHEAETAPLAICRAALAAFDK